jgi:hypothetical protein
MTKKPKLPAISHEMAFVSRYVDETDEIWEDKVKVDPKLQELSNTVYERAEEDVDKLLDDLKDALELGAKKSSLRVNDWHWHWWGRWSQIYLPGRKKKNWLGWIERRFRKRRFQINCIDRASRGESWTK